MRTFEFPFPAMCKNVYVSMLCDIEILDIIILISCNVKILRIHMGAGWGVQMKIP